MSNKHHHVCPAALAGSLDNKIRRWLQNPPQDAGTLCPGGDDGPRFRMRSRFFYYRNCQNDRTIGPCIAADLQEGMLQKVGKKIAGTELEKRIKLHKSEETGIGVSEKVDFVLAFYMVHEVPDQGGLFKEIASLLKPGGRLLMVEPPFHVSKAAFEGTIEKSAACGA